MNGESSVDDTRMRDKQKTRRQDKLSRLQMLCYKTLRLASPFGVNCRYCCYLIAATDKPPITATSPVAKTRDRIVRM